jgi:hypothetical protein
MKQKKVTKTKGVLKTQVLAGMAALLLVFGLVLAGCPMEPEDDDPDGGPDTEQNETEDSFTSKTDNSTANDEATLGFAGENASSSNESVATAAITDGKIVITSKKAGTATITVSKTNVKSATFTVTVADDGGISISNIVTGGDTVTFTAATDSDTANTEDALGLVGTSVASSNTGVATAAITDGKIVITSVSAGTAVITVSGASGSTPATIAVTVADDGGITIGAITKGASTGGTPGGSGKAATPTANPASGEVNSGTKIYLETDTADAVIYYTIDGTDPTTDSTQYIYPTTPPAITTSPTTLKAIAVKDGMDNSEVLTATYTINNVSVWTLADTDSLVHDDNVMLMDITHSNDRFIVWYNDGSVAYSDDGVSWKAVENNPFDQNGLSALKSIAWGGDIFVALGYDGTRKSSTDDGETWTEQTPFDGSITVKGIVWAGDKFVAHCSDSTMKSSTDGQTWEALANPDGFDEITGIYGDGNTFVIENDSNLAYPDNGSWKVIDKPFSTFRFDGIAWSEDMDKFFMFNNSTRYYSTNGGEEWSQYYGSDLNISTSSNIAWGGGKFVIVGSTSAIYYSADGIDWKGAGIEVSQSSYSRGIVWGKDKFVAAYSKGEILYSNVQE